MLSASAGSLSRRYRSALASARGTASGDSVFSSNMVTSAKYSQQLRHGIVQLVDDALLERDDGVVGDRDAFRADLRAAFRDIAVADAVHLLQIARPMFLVEGVHLERGRVDQMPRSDELVEHAVVPQNVAHVLAEETFDALAELLHALGIDLGHPPRAVRVRRRGPEWLDALLRPEVPRHVCYEVADGWEGAHRLDGDRGREIELI